MATIRGGQNLVDKLHDFAVLVTNARAVQIGFLAGATYPDGKPVAMIAAIQEYGAPSRGIPPRPFFRNMIAAKSKEWGPAMAELLKENGYDAFRTLQQTGEAVAGQLRQSIVDTNDPPLAAATLRARGYTGGAYNPKNPATFGAKPLVDTGHMLNSVEYEVKA